MDKFDWQASECAPKNYPMQIIKGILLYHGDYEEMVCMFQVEPLLV